MILFPSNDGTIANLRSIGYTNPDYNDGLYKYLYFLGYRGTLSDMLYVATSQGLTNNNMWVDFFAPFADAGSGAVTTTLSSGVGSPIFTRATSAWTFNSSGLLVQVASGTARSRYNPLTLEYQGYLTESAATNVALHSRNMTNAAWVATNITPVLTATGLDGVANSASTITSSAGNGTIFQTVVLASSTRTYSAYIKRRTGTGTISMTTDGGVTYTNITSLLSSTSYNLVQITQAAVTNPVFGFRITTSGDAIDVDCNQNETGTFATSPIVTTTTSVIRNADALNYATGNSINATGTAAAEVSTNWTTSVSVNSVILSPDNTSYFMNVGVNGVSTQLYSNDGTSNVLKGTLSDMRYGVRKRASSWGAAGRSVTGDGLAPVTGAFDGAIGAATSVFVGCISSSGGSNFNGTIKNVRIWHTQLSDSVLQTLTT